METGETLEEAIAREKTGIKIRNIRNFDSQPWPYPCGLMVVFNADYESSTIHLLESELT